MKAGPIPFTCLISANGYLGFVDRRSDRGLARYMGSLA
jgi:hypothetical protein